MQEPGLASIQSNPATTFHIPKVQKAPQTWIHYCSDRGEKTAKVLDLHAEVHHPVILN